MVVDTCLVKSVLVLLHGKSLIIGDSSSFLALADLDLDNVALCYLVAGLYALLKDDVVIVIVVILIVGVESEVFLVFVLGKRIELLYQIRPYPKLTMNVCCWTWWIPARAER